jgi:hypothetical protein
MDFEHQQELAKIEANANVEIANLDHRNRIARRTWLGWFFVGLAVLIGILSLLLTIKNVHDEDRKVEERVAVKHQEVIEQCISQGNIWLDGNCLIAQRSAP